MMGLKCKSYLERLKLAFLFLLPGLCHAQTLGFALEQTGGQYLIDAGLTGKGVKIGIIDGGFLKADQSPTLSEHFTDGRVAFYKDYITPELGEYKGSKPSGDDHGTQVWEHIGGYHPELKIQYGLATEATYYLARTDHDAFESRKEEKLLIQALAEMIAMDVKLVNISLGYTEDYTDKSENYTPDMVDGRSTWITRVLDSVLLQNPHVLVVVSAGNDGNTRWKTLSPPADSPNVLTVGACKLQHPEEMAFSSIGPIHIGYVKPDLVCFSTQGTSFSAPIVTGLAAGLMQKYPDASVAEIKQLLIASGSLYPYPNNVLGHGVPSGKRIMKGQSAESHRVVRSSKNSVRVPLADEPSKITLYHKEDWRVAKKMTVKGKPTVRVKRVPNTNRCTVLYGSTAMEIIWEQ